VRPETYIVRIYRRMRSPSRKIAGRVETPNGKLFASFATSTELTAILESPKAHLRGGAGARSKTLQLKASVPKGMAAKCTGPRIRAVVSKW